MPPFTGTFGAAGPRRTSHFPKTKAPRCPDHITYASSLGDESILRGLVCKHVCKHPIPDAEGQQHDCCHRLHGADVTEAVEHLRKTRRAFLKTSFRQRREFLYGLTRCRPGSSSGPRAIVDFLMTGASGDVRLVCRPVVRAAYPSSDRTLDRICKRRRTDVGAHALCAGRTFIDSEKKREAIGWWLAYAEATAEHLPDQPFLITPCRHKSEIYREYKEDLAAAGKEKLTMAEPTFIRLFNKAKELDHVGISALKANFGRCSTCTRLEEAVQRALKQHNENALAVAKAERRAHLMGQRGDRMEYWKRKAESRNGTRASFIIDKMDSSKNQVPCWTNRWPKDAVKHAEHILTLHVVGVIFHGEPE